MFINRISASKSDVIDQCLWKYNLKYILKIPGFGSPNEESLNFGSFIHKVFEIGYRQSDPKELFKIAEQTKGNYKVPFNLTDKTKKCIENFVLWNSKLGETVSTEMAFEVPLDKEHDINFNGVIDRIIKGSDGGYLVIDYKTSKTEKKKKDLADDKQMQGYAYAIHILYGVDISKIVCAHYYPVTGNFVPVRFSKIQIWNWKKKEIEKVWRIRKKTKDEFPPQKNIFCDWCEFKSVCEKFNSKEEVCKRLDEQLALRDRILEEKNNSNNAAEQDSADHKGLGNK
jgi:CRISPR/Cas system-associated exonuclease Cas4 (RecB family)